MQTYQNNVNFNDKVNAINFNVSVNANKLYRLSNNKLLTWELIECTIFFSSSGNGLIRSKNNSEMLSKITGSKRSICYRKFSVNIGNLLISGVSSDSGMFFAIVGNSENVILYFRNP